MRRLMIRLLPLLVAGAAAAAPVADADSLVAWHGAGRPDLVETHAGPLIDAARADADDVALLELLLIRGATRAGFGRARPAEGDLREALGLAVAQEDSVALRRCTRWLGVSVGLQGRVREATDLYGELETLARAADDSLHLGWSWVGLAYGHYLAGRSGPAADHYLRAAAVLESQGEQAGAVWAWNGHAMVLRQAGRYREARASFERVLALAEDRDDAVNTATALDNLGRLDLQLGDPGRAERQFTRAAAIHRAHQHHREGLVPSIDLARARHMQGRYPAAEALLDSVLVVARELGLRDLEVLAAGQLAEVRMSRQRPAAAAAICRAILAEGAMPSQLADTEIRLKLARALVERDSTAAAVVLLESIDQPGAVSLELATANLLGTLNSDLGRTERALAVLTPAVDQARRSGADVERVVLLTHLGRALADAGRPEEALTAYGEAVDTWEDVRSRPSDPAWRELRGMVAGSLFAQAAALLVADRERVGEAWSLVQRYRARTLQERMHGTGASAARGVVAAPDLTAFRRGFLRPGEVWCEVVEGDRVGVVFAMTRDKVLAVPIPGRRRTDGPLSRLSTVLASPDVADAGPAVRQARALTDAWPISLRALLGVAERVLWCPDGSWHRLPTALLDDGRTWMRVPAATVLVGLRYPGPERRGASGILAHAGPDPRRPGPLPGAVAEVRWLADNLRGVSPVVYAAGDTAAVDWRQAEILHLAAHTRLESWLPWHTAIMLDRTPTGRVGADDIVGLDLQARLVVLTGCTTLGSQLRGGEGLIGLGGAFLAAGVPTVLATLWPVDDAVAMRVTTAFYEALADGLTAERALALARRTCRDDPAMAAPCHWAGFTLVGDGDVKVPVERRGRRWPLAAGLGLLAVGFVAWWRRS